MLELAVTPYDVLRLKKATGLSSDKFLDTYIIIEQDPGEPFPRFYLTMVNDGRASCIFVKSEGCSVYDNRPSACRAYPVGRAAMRTIEGKISEHFVLMQEAHCLGFNEPVEQNVMSYSQDQELVSYNTFNDALIEIVQHESIRKGFIPSKKHTDLYVLALYNLDLFRKKIFSGEILLSSLTKSDKELLSNDEELLLFGISWVKDQLFILP